MLGWSQHTCLWSSLAHLCISNKLSFFCEPLKDSLFHYHTLATWKRYIKSYNITEWAVMPFLLFCLKEKVKKLSEEMIIFSSGGEILKMNSIFWWRKGAMLDDLPLAHVISALMVSVFILYIPTPAHFFHWFFTFVIFGLARSVSCLLRPVSHSRLFIFLLSLSLPWVGGHHRRWELSVWECVQVTMATLS